MRRRGQAMVEFALVLGVIALLCFALLQIGFLFYTYLVLQNAVHDGARAASVRACPSDQDTRDILAITKQVASAITDETTLDPQIAYSGSFPRYGDMVTVTLAYRMQPFDGLTRAVFPGWNTVFEASGQIRTGCQVASRSVTLQPSPTPPPTTLPAPSPTPDVATTSSPLAVTSTATPAEISTPVGLPMATLTETPTPSHTTVPTPIETPIETPIPSRTTVPTNVPTRTSTAVVPSVVATTDPIGTPTKTVPPTTIPTPFPIAQSVIAYKQTRSGSDAPRTLSVQGRVYEVGTGKGVPNKEMILQVESLYQPTRTVRMQTGADGYVTLCVAAIYRLDDQISIGAEPISNGSGISAQGIVNVTVQITGDKLWCP